MSVDSKITGFDRSGTKLEAGISQVNKIIGLNVFTAPLSQRTTLFQPALNDTFGNEMAVDASFSGTPDGIHNGTDSIWWTGSALTGVWDFVSTTNPRSGTKCIDATGTVNSDQALFTRSSTIDLSAYTAITGFIRLESWGSGTKHVEMQARLAGVLVGLSVFIDDFIDTNSLNTYQKYTISLATMGIELETIDEIVITTIKTNGSNPDYRIDDWQIEQIGSPIEFTIEAPTGFIYFIDSVYLNYADVLNITLLNNSVPNIDHQKILGLASLPNGIVFQRIRQQEVIFSATIKNIGDSVKGGANISTIISDSATNNTCLTIRVDFDTPVLLDSALGDKIAIIINDDMTDLTSFTSIATGSIEDNFNIQ